MYASAAFGSSVHSGPHSSFERNQGRMDILEPSPITILCLFAAHTTPHPTLLHIHVSCVCTHTTPHRTLLHIHVSCVCIHTTPPTPPCFTFTSVVCQTVSGSEPTVITVEFSVSRQSVALSRSAKSRGRITTLGRELVQKSCLRSTM